jgi:ribosomal RNA assembly protein|tara:strand:- start:244 stop:744 length:501 start_codon:yes stop_codon:yes gene_type:complete
MKVIIVDKLVRVTKNKAKLEKTLGVKISNRGKEVSIQGKAEEEYIAEKVIDALNIGFPYSAAISIKTEDNVFEIINIKDHTNRPNLERVRARIIGKAGRTLRTISNLTECNLERKGNDIGIIGPPENIENAQNAIISIIKGSKQSNVYAGLEKSKTRPITDLGLKK